jgi:hypothetical protein
MVCCGKSKVVVNPAPQGDRMQEIAGPSVRSLLIEMLFDDQPLATATAFAVDGPKGPLLVTNRHNVTGRNPSTDQPLSKSGGVPNNVKIIHNHATTLGQWVSTTERLYDVHGKQRWLEHPRLKEKADFVALPLMDLANVRTFSYDPSSPGPDIYVGPADSLSVIGFPFGLTAGGAFPIWATGFMASRTGD